MQDSERPQMDASQSGQAPPRVRPGLYSEDPAHGQGRRRDGRRQRQSTATATATATAARAPKKHTERETAGAALPSHARRRIPAAHVAAHYALRFTPYAFAQRCTPARRKTLVPAAHRAAARHGRLQQRHRQRLHKLLARLGTSSALRCCPSSHAPSSFRRGGTSTSARSTRST